MIREKVDASKERQIILYSITSTEYLKEIRNLAREELFKSTYAKIVWRWCSQYFDEYGMAPGKDIQDIYIAHRMEIQDEDEDDTVAHFLQSLSDSDEQLNNVQYALQTAIDWLRIRHLTVLSEQITDALKMKDIASAEAAVASYASIKRQKIEGVDLLSDSDAAVNAFEEEGEILFRFPGAMGAVVGECRRTDFISFLGYAKRGKSWWLWETAKVAMLHSNKVLFVSLEMPIKQVLRRLWRSLSQRPKYDMNVKIPFFVKDDTSDDNIWEVDYEERPMKKFVPDKAWVDDWIKNYKRYFRGGDVKVVSMPARSVTVTDIVTYMDNLEYYHDWIPDVIILDYADLINSKMKGEYRHQLDDIWANLRRIALERNICIVTASQSGRQSANGDSTDENIAEDIRKVAHVTKMIAINATKDEKRKGLYRLAQIAERDDSTCFEQCYVLHCLDIGQVCLDSRFRSEVRMNKND